MGIEPEILVISAENKEILSEFIKELDKEQDSFRYFKNRSLDTIGNHLLTILLLDSGKPIGYGHLDQENEVIWLGIVIKSSYQGKGLANKLMETLLSKGEEKGIKRIRLSVDNNNEKAISLYEKFGFEFLKAGETYSIYQRTIKN